MKLLVSLACFVLGLSRILDAAPAAIANLTRLTSDSDAIIVGEVSGATGSGTSAYLLLRVARAIKGDLLPGTLIKATALQVADAPSEGGRLKGLIGIWFLKKSGGSWAVMPTVAGRVPPSQQMIPVPAAPPPALAIDQAAAPEDRLLSELLMAFSSGSNVQIVEDYLVMGLGGGLSPGGVLKVSGLAESLVARERILGVSMLLRSSVTRAPAKALLLANAEAGADAQNKLARSLCQYRGLLATDTQDVGRLSTREFPLSIRRCALYSLRAVHSEAALPYLAPLLDDSDFGTRYDALYGIAAYFLQIPVQVGVPVFPSSASNVEHAKHLPSRDVFLKDETAYISYWKSWLANRK